MLLELNNSERAAITVGDKSISFRWLNKESDKVAKIFYKSFKQQIIVLQSTASIEYVIHLFAIWKAGKVPCILNSQYSQTIKEQCLTRLSCYSFIEPKQQSVSKTKDGTSLLPEQAALILFTSGSSAQPKAVVLSWENIHANIKAVQESLEFEQVQYQDLCLSLSYSFGLCGQLLPALASSVNTFLYEDIGGLIRNVGLPREKLMLSGVPEQLKLLARVFQRFPSACSHISHVVTAGAPLNIKPRRELMETFCQATIFANYGMTECSPRVLSISSRDPDFLGGGSGYPVPGIKTMLTQDGELLISGKQVMMGYLEGNDLIFPWKVCGFQKTVHSGDQAKIKNGLHYILGHKDAQIKVSGVKISCQEIDQVYEKHPDLIRVCCIPVPCETYGQRVIVFASPKQQNIDSDLILNELRPQLLHQAAVKKLILLADWPLTPHGKTDRQFFKRHLKEQIV